jgi:hypothetical protein
VKPLTEDHTINHGRKIRGGAEMNYFMTGVLLTLFGNMIAGNGTFLGKPVPLFVTLIMQFLGVAFVLDYYLSLRKN